MPTSRILSLAPDGRPPYSSSNGLLYGQRISFEDGAVGLVNTKTATPPYRVGDTMSYEITGKAGQNNKMKVSKPKDGSAPQSQRQQESPQQTHPDLEPAARSSTSSTPSTGSALFHEKMKGNALLYLHALAYARKINTTLKETGHPVLENEHFQACVSTLFIAGDRAECAVNPPAITPKPAAGQPQGGRADAPKSNTKPPTGPDGSVALPPGDEDVPF